MLFEGFDTLVPSYRIDLDKISSVRKIIPQLEQDICRIIVSDNKSIDKRSW